MPLFMPVVVVCLAGVAPHVRWWVSGTGMLFVVGTVQLLLHALVACIT